MFESRTYEALLASALSRVASPVDKREGSMVMNGVAPSMAELAQLYIAADFVLQATYIITAPVSTSSSEPMTATWTPTRPAPPSIGRSLTLRSRRGPVSPARTSTLWSLPAWTRRRTRKPASATRLPVKPRSGGQQLRRHLIPVEYVQGLTHAELVELLIPGDDEEETEAFRQRVLDSFQSQAFGGNQADYREKVLAMPGVGTSKSTPSGMATFPRPA